MKKNIKNILLLFFVGFLLIGCGTKEKDAGYHEAIQAGLDYVAAADYSRAQSEFEKALAEKPEDAHAEALLAQTTHYKKAVEARLEEKIELALEELEKVLEIDGGSAGLMTKAEEFIKNLQRMLVKADEIEEAVQETEVPADEPEVESEPTETTPTEPEKPETPSASAYTYEDFRGIYTTFEGEPYHSQMVNLLMIEENEILVGFAYSNFVTYPVAENIINGNKLAIYFIDESESEQGIFEVMLEDDGKLTTDVYTYYPVTREQTEEVGLTLPYLD